MWNTVCSRCRVGSIDPMIIWSRVSLNIFTFEMFDVIQSRNHVELKEKLIDPVSLPKWFADIILHLLTIFRNSGNSISCQAFDATPSFLTLCSFILFMNLCTATDFVGFLQLLSKSHFMSLFGIKYDIAFFENSIVDDLPCVGLLFLGGLLVPKTLFDMQW